MANICTFTDALQLPGGPALLQFVRSNLELWPDYDVEFQEP